MALPALANHSALKELLRVQIQEPEQERRLRKTIRTLTPINDGISRAVRQQYEENPYPRWVVPRILRCASATEYAQSQTPLKADAVPLQPETPDVLIAGCGSGQQPVEVAISVPLARITAVDLSLTAMAYGMRKAEELGLSTIKFAQADLLELGAWTQRYDMIMCTGVLHHLEQPEKGLDVLLSLLKPGGIMKLALYSEAGRQSIVAGRDFIAAKGYAPSGEGIRQCRRDIFALPPSDPVRAVAERSDFYALSPCRDLLFHVQEHRFTIPQIKALLAERNLRLLGFIYSKVSRFTSYLARFPDNPEADNLDNWEIYEAENPMTFKNMYQFSVTRA
jgi:2-polyprenyl-3-methyl-5-hydroxy-6-metoxy-1,4-benzoquinol methylase